MILSNINLANASRSPTVGKGGEKATTAQPNLRVQPNNVGWECNIDDEDEDERNRTNSLRPCHNNPFRTPF